MNGRWTRKERLAWLAAVALLAGCSAWQTRQLRLAQLEDKKALYAERLRTAQVIVENEMLAAAYLTSTDPHIRARARAWLDRSPK